MGRHVLRAPHAQGCLSTQRGEHVMQRARSEVLGTFVCLAAAVSPGAVVQAGLLKPAWQPNWTLGGVATRLIEVPLAAPVGVGTCPGVRPGAIVNSDTGQCTFNFVFLGS